MTLEILAEQLRKRTRLGFILAGCWFFLSVVFLIVGMAGWGVQMTPYLSLLASLGLLIAYAILVYDPQRKIGAAMIQVQSSTEAYQKRLLYILQRVRHGDLVIEERRMAGLPDNLIDGISKTTGSLTAQISKIQERSLEVALVGGEVQSTSTELASGFSEQSAAVVEITATIEELARTAAQISQNAEHQAELAEIAETEGNRGAESVQAAVQGLGGLSERITGIAERADSLGTRSNEIYRILDLINEIAHDTHILSLNAAIEAETAGEHGRRFAVVAEEVRRLAQRARESVQSVRSHLEEFSAAIRSTVVATEEGTKEANHVLQQAQAAQGSIEELRSALSATSLAAQEISFATKEQRTASSQVAVTIKEVREVIQRMADGLRNFTGTARNLNDVALAIQLVTQAFRFPSPRSLKNVFREHAEKVGKHAGNWEHAGEDLNELLNACNYVEFAYMVDANGNLMAHATSSEWSQERRGAREGVVTGKNYADRPWFRTVQQTHAATLTPLYESLLTSQQCFTIAIPILSEGREELVGVLGADINMTSWIKI